MLKKVEKLRNALDAYGEFRPCPICGSSDYKPFLELDNFQFYLDSKDGSSKQFSVLDNICLNCSAIYMNPVYSAAGFDILFREAGKSYGALAKHIDDQISWLNENGLLEAGDSVLDVGCYDGDFLSRLPKSNFKYGVDLDRLAIERAKEKLSEEDAELFVGRFESFDFDHPAPSLITMFHVLEHMPYPVEVLKNLRTISNEKTRLAIEVPIIEKGMTNDINGFFSIQHTTHFSRGSLKNCLNRAGWAISSENTAADYNGYRVVALAANKAGDDITFNTADWGLLSKTLSNWYKSIHDVEAAVTAIPFGQDVVLWGAGAHTEFLYQKTSLFHSCNRNFLIVDSDPVKQGGTWRRISIKPPEIITELDWREFVLVPSTYGSQKEVVSLACELGVPSEKVVQLYKEIIQY